MREEGVGGQRTEGFKGKAEWKERRKNKEGSQGVSMEGTEGRNQRKEPKEGTEGRNQRKEPREGGVSKGRWIRRKGGIEGTKEKRKEARKESREGRRPIQEGTEGGEEGDATEVQGGGTERKEIKDRRKKPRRD
jgi:hypothetical protein